MNIRPHPYATALSSVLFFSTLSAASAALVVRNSNFNGNSNYAPDGLASQTTTAYGGVPSRANDGLIAQGYAAGTTTHSDDAVPGAQAWQVDLLQNRTINQIALFNRGEGINNRLSNFRLQVLDSTLTEVWGADYHTAGTSVADSEVFNIMGGVSGQHVRVQQLGLNAAGNNILSLTEVQAIGFRPVMYPNVALGGVAAQSGTAYGGAASRANDGNTDGFFGNNSVTHSDDLAAPGTPTFLEIDLMADFKINELAVYNRLDCCWTRLSNFRLSVWNDGAEVWGENMVSATTMKGMFSVHDDAGGFFVTGDKVRLELIGGLNGDGNNTLSLAEFQVFGVPVPEPTLAGLVGVSLAIGGRRRRRVA